jgi:hypothetical protein
MSPERTFAYRRVLQTLADMGPSKLQSSEQDRVRFAADTLLFSTDLYGDESAREALTDSEQLCRSLVDSGRWEPVTAQQLADDIRSCGPSVEIELEAA